LGGRLTLQTGRWPIEGRVCKFTSATKETGHGGGDIDQDGIQ
jgi:hypothetical protein